MPERSKKGSSYSRTASSFNSFRDEQLGSRLQAWHRTLEIAHAAKQQSPRLGRPEMAMATNDSGFTM